MDHNANAAARYFADADASHDHACYAAAQQSGHTIEEADKCDDFSVDCATCPFRRDAS